MILNRNRSSRTSTPGTLKWRVILFSVAAAALLVGLTACNDTVSEQGENNDYLNILILNEGNWSDSNGSVTRYNPLSGQVTQEMFEHVNERPLAAIIQDGVVAGEYLFLVANNSDKVEVTDLLSLESVGTVDLGGEDGFTPAGFAMAGETTGYISSLYTNEVAVVNLESFELTGTRIAVGDNPQDLLVVGDRLFVANNGFGEDNTVTVINIDTNEVVTTVEVGHGPRQLVLDSAGRVWVVANGLQAYDEDWNRDPENDIEGRVDILNGSTGERISVIETGGFPSALALGEDRGQAWLVNSESVQQISLGSFEITDETFIDRRFNGLSYSALESRLYLAESRGYEQSGQAVIYDLQGVAVDSVQAGIAPQEFHFQVDLN